MTAAWYGQLDRSEYAALAVFASGGYLLMRGLIRFWTGRR